MVNSLDINKIHDIKNSLLHLSATFISNNIISPFPYYKSIEDTTGKNFFIPPRSTIYLVIIPYK